MVAMLRRSTSLGSRPWQARAFACLSFAPSRAIVLTIILVIFAIAAARAAPDAHVAPAAPGTHPRTSTTAGNPVDSNWNGATKARQRSSGLRQQYRPIRGFQRPTDMAAFSEQVCYLERS